MNGCTSRRTCQRVCDDRRGTSGCTTIIRGRYGSQSNGHSDSSTAINLRNSIHVVERKESNRDEGLESHGCKRKNI